MSPGDNFRVLVRASGLLSKVFAWSDAGVAQLARASAFQAEGRGFESRFPLQIPAHIAQEGEHFLGKEEVTGSSPVVGSTLRISRTIWV